MRPGLSVLIPADVRFPLERANGVQIVKTAAALARAGVDTTLLVRKSDDRPTAEILALYGVAPDPRLTVERLSVFHRRGSFRLPRASFLLRAGVRSARALLGKRIVFTRDLQLADLLLRGGGRRLVYEAHAVESLLYGERDRIYGAGAPAEPRKKARLARREARVWRRAAGFVATTAGILDSFRAEHGQRALVEVVPNGCDPPGPGGLRGLADEDPPRILYAGQLYPWKGVDVLVEAFAQLGCGRLVILGGLSGEADLTRIRARVEARGLRERVEMPGSVPHARVAEELARASVVVVPFLHTAMTERHTSPLKVFEAMAAGRPIVASDLPSTREVLRDGENALLVPAGDAGAMAAALTRLLRERGLAERLAATARAESASYSWEARARRLQALFEGLP
jgi:glycosyltransferase involved in cell wall biosynthesis